MTTKKKSANTERFRTFSKVLDFGLTAALMLIAIMVFAGILRGDNMWAWIGSYWFTLAAKNINLFIAHEGLD